MQVSSSYLRIKYRWTQINARQDPLFKAVKREFNSARNSKFIHKNLIWTTNFHASSNYFLMNLGSLLMNFLGVGTEQLPTSLRVASLFMASTNISPLFLIGARMWPWSL